ncbi:hypothetical protein vBVpaMR16F_45 [Vibrio phage vB_VpaM_R16F]|nr:hypothetical protein vBVpaMR16F_45 [Vibrio phage vB_VpaM_R16F]
MSSFPQHEENVKDLQDMGFDVSDCLDKNGDVTLESWGYDELVYLMSGVVRELIDSGYIVQNSKE